MVKRPDVADWLLAIVVRLLPTDSREWGAAMRAELAGIGARHARWGFVVGCVRVVATRPAVLRRVGYPLLTVGVLAATLWWTSRIAYAPLRWRSFWAVAVLLGVAWLGRRSGPLGPVARGRTARGVRAGGYVLLTVWTVTLMAAIGTKDPVEQARYAVPIFGVLLAGYLVGFLTLTAARSAATAWVRAAGLAGGGAAAIAWTTAVVVAPPIPAEIGPAVALICIGMLVAALATGRRGGAELRLLAALCAGTVAAMLIVSMVVVLSTFAPPSMIPPIVMAALTPADDLAQSRVELQDPYLWVLLLGGVIAALQSAAALSSRQHAPSRPERAAAS